MPRLALLHACFGDLLQVGRILLGLKFLDHLIRLALIALGIKFFQEVFHLVPNILTVTESEMVMVVLINVVMAP